MKKILLVTVILGAAIAFTSCSKETEHTCKCDYSGSAIVSYSEATVLAGIDEDAAKSTCTSFNETGTGYTSTCALVD
jgi:hypothetical protein